MKLEYFLKYGCLAEFVLKKHIEAGGPVEITTLEIDPREVERRVKNLLKERI